jgi:hypothetical protein
MASIAGSAAEGLESGFGLGLRFDQQQQAQKQREFENQRQTAADQRAADLAARQAAHESWMTDRQNAIDAQQALLAEQGQLQKEAAAAAAEQQRTGQLPDPQYQADFTQRQQANASQLRAVRDKLVSPLVGKMKQDAQDTVSKLQSKQIDMQDLTPSQLVQTLTAITDRPASDFLPVQTGKSAANDFKGSGTRPSFVSQAFTDFQTGQQTGNESMMLKGLNTLLQPELMKGLGDQTPNGGTITAKRIVKIVPDQNDPKKVHPVLAIDSKDAQGNPLPTYTAPVTINRSTHPDDQVAPIDLDSAIDRLQRLQTVATMVANPAVAKLIAEHKDDPSSVAYLNALRSSGASPKQNKADEQEASIRRYQQENNVDRDTAVAQMQKAGTLPTPKPPGVLAQRLAAVANEPNATVLQRDIALGAGGKTTGLIPVKSAAARVPGAVASGPTPANASLHGDELLGTLDTQTAQIVKDIADGKQSLKDISMKGGRREQIASLVGRYSSDYSSSKYPTAAATEKAFATGVEGRKLRSFNVAIDHLDTLAQAGQALANGDVQKLNQMKNFFQEQFGVAAPTNFDAIKRIVADEVVAGVVGSTGALADREEAAKSIMRSSSPEQLAGTIRGFQQLLGGQLKGLAQQYQAGGGSKDFANAFLTPRARQFTGGLGTQKPAAPALSAADNDLINKFLKR